MSISTKNRRKLIFGEREFVWYVKEDSDSADMVLHVASRDKQFIVLYHLRQPSETRFLTVLGKRFSGLPDAGGVWIRVLCPEFETNFIVTPRNVRDLIEWCLSDKRELVRVDWLGRPLKSELVPSQIGV